MSFFVFEASISDLHAAIKNAEITCEQVVLQYLERVRAFNGPSSLLVTPTGDKAPEVPGKVRGGQRLRFPTQTIPASEIFPDLDRKSVV